ncbi:MAG: hypothetical protein K9N62_18715 [Verrucomicrobia bacterium]|nr:hypothetical protein [Verrucomicrobiota bacterium]
MKGPVLTSVRTAPPTNALFKDLIRGDWFERRGRDHHTGAIYLNGDWLTEAVNLEEVLMPGGTAPGWLTGANSDGALNSQLWFARVNADQTTIWAQFKGVNPNTEHVEINVRQTVFYPDQPGRNFITVRGFTMRHAATPWAPPTAEQIGLIGTHWSRGWVIESNVISHSTCSGIDPFFQDGPVVESRSRRKKARFSNVTPSV